MHGRALRATSTSTARPHDGGRRDPRERVGDDAARWARRGYRATSALQRSPESLCALAGNVSEAVRKQGATNIRGCGYELRVAAIGQPEPGRPGSRRASAGTTRRFQPVLTHRALEDASHEPSRGLTFVVVLKRAPCRRQSSLPVQIADEESTCCGVSSTTRGHCLGSRFVRSKT